MRGMRVLGAVLLPVAVIAGCEDLGLPGENIPLEIARTAPPKPLEEQAVRLAPTPVPGIPEGGVSVGEQVFTPTATEYTLADADVTRIGEAGGAAIFALRWDASPYDYVLVRLPSGRYARLDPLRVRSSPETGPVVDEAEDTT